MVNNPILENIDNYEIKEENIIELASVLHDMWRSSRFNTAEPQQINGKTEMIAVYEPEIKQTKDDKWINSHNGKTTVDIANTDFVNLPSEWKQENYQKSKDLLLQIHKIIPEMGNLVHKNWLKRNRWEKKDKDAKLPFSKISNEEKEKNLSHVYLGMYEITKDYAKGIIQEDRLFGEDKNFKKLIDTMSEVDFVKMTPNKMEDLANEMAEVLHNQWQTSCQYPTREKKVKDKDWISNYGKNIVNIKNTKYKELPRDWKKENIMAAKSALKMVDKYSFDIASEIHDNELKRNSSEKNGELDVSFKKLPMTEKMKIMQQVYIAMALQTKEYIKYLQQEKHISVDREKTLLEIKKESQQMILQNAIKNKDYDILEKEAKKILKKDELRQTYDIIESEKSLKNYKDSISSKDFVSQTIFEIANNIYNQTVFNKQMQSSIIADSILSDDYDQSRESQQTEKNIDKEIESNEKIPDDDLTK